MRGWTVAVAVGLAACDGGSGADDTAGGDVTWDDVAPILEARCTGCHQPDGVGPMALASYDDAVPWAESIKATTAARTMPPWLAVDDGSCGTFEDSLWLSDEEIATFAAWADGGAKRGAAGEVTPRPPPTLGDRRDLALVTPEIVPVAEGDLFAPNDEYRCFAFPNEAGRDWFLTGYEVVPGNEAIVHHVLAMVLDPDAPGWSGETNAEVIAAMEAQDARPGWDCIGTVGGDAREKGIPGTWAPGQGAVTFPDGLGVRVRSSDWIVLQIHYSLAAPDTEGQSDTTTMYLRTEEQVEREAYVALPDALLESLFNFPQTDLIPPGEPAYDYDWTMTGWDILDRALVEDQDVESFQLWSVMPHMHQRGRAQSMRVKRAGGGRECVMDVPRWDFEWQRIYAYEEPVEIAVDDEVKVTCTFDTTDMTQPMLPGWGTQNEMCLVVMMLTLD